MITTKMIAIRGDSIDIPLLVEKNESATYLAQLRLTPESAEYYPLTIDWVNMVMIVTTEQSRTFVEDTYIAEIEENLDGVITTLQRTCISIELDVARDYGTPVDGWSSDDISETIRKALTPTQLVTHLVDGVDFTTPLIPANTPTQVVLPVTVKYAKDFTIAPGGGAQYTRDKTARLFLVATTSMSTGTNNVIVKFMMYANGVRVPGVATKRKIATGGDVGSISVEGVFDVVKDDILEVYVEVSIASTITFSLTSFAITEI